MKTTDPGGATKPALDRKRLALDRTWLAHERTLMAWVRTATSMIGFGFTIYKFFQFETGDKGTQFGVLTPRDFALVMISIGVLTLALASVSRRTETREICEQLGRKSGSLSELVAGLVFLFGIVLLLATAFRS